MPNALILYATRQGQTSKIAERIADTLRGAGHAVTLLDAAQSTAAPDFTRFDVLFIGAPVHVGGYPRELVRLVRKHREALGGLRTALFSVGLAVVSKTHDGRAQTMPLVERFLARTGLRPDRVELIAGALKYSQYNLFIRYVMRRIAEQEGGDTDTSRDYEYTDWSAVDRFAIEFAERPSGARATQPSGEVASPPSGAATS